MGDVVVVMGEWRFIVTRRRVVRCHPHMSAFLVTLVDIVILLSSGPSSRAVVRKCSRLVRKAGLLATLTAVVRKCSRLVRKAGLLAILIIIVIVTIVVGRSAGAGT